MRVGIICAGDTELAPFWPVISDCKITEKAMLKFYEGTISGVEVVALFSGRHSGSEYFEENCEKASKIAKDITVALLEELYNRMG